MVNVGLPSDLPEQMSTERDDRVVSGVETDVAFKRAGVRV